MEAASQRQATSDLSQQLSKAEGRTNSLENEVHRLSLQLTEKGLLLEVLQRDRDQAGARAKDLEQNLQAERERVISADTRQQAMQERLVHAQSESHILQQQLAEAQNKGDVKERAVTDAQQRFSDMLLQLRADSEDRVQLLEDRNKELQVQASNQRDLINQQEEEKKDREVGWEEPVLQPTLKTKLDHESTLNIKPRGFMFKVLLVINEHVNCLKC